MNKFLKYSIREPLPDERKISYSQFSMYSTCPKHWELAYVKGLRTFSQSIHTIFGTAMHETLQHFLTVMYDESVKAAEEIDLNKYLKDQMFTLYKEAVEKMGDHFSNKFELGEFYEDGVAIIDWFKKRRGQYFSRKNEELIGIEVPIYHPVDKSNDKLMMLGYLDIVIRDKRDNKITIIDFVFFSAAHRKSIECIKCVTCGLELKTESALLKHKNKVHRGMNFVCDICMLSTFVILKTWDYTVLHTNLSSLHVLACICLYYFVVHFACYIRICNLSLVSREPLGGSPRDL